MPPDVNVHVGPIPDPMVPAKVNPFSVKVCPLLVVIFFLPAEVSPLHLTMLVPQNLFPLPITKRTGKSKYFFKYSLPSSVTFFFILVVVIRLWKYGTLCAVLFKHIPHFIWPTIVCVKGGTDHILMISACQCITKG